MKNLMKLVSVLVIFALLLSYPVLKASEFELRQPPDHLKDLCYERLWDVLLHPTNDQNNRTRQDMLHEIAELLSKIGYRTESLIPSRRQFSLLMNQNRRYDLYELIDWTLIDLCLLIREPIPIMTTVTVDYAEVLGTIRDFRQVNDGIFSYKRDSKGMTTELQNYSSRMKELGMTSIRTHDAYGEVDSNTRKVICGLDMHYLYPDTGKDPFDPASYQFDIMDKWAKEIDSIGAQVFFRVGESWDVHPQPPKNVDNYVQAVVQILKHYQKGWAQGFSYKINYWEIWNEPALKVFWTGTSDQFIQMYAKIALALKKEDPSIMVGGPGNAGNFQNDWYFKFFAYLRDHHIPFDFYSWHWYGIRPYEANIIAQDVQKDLDGYGFTQTKQLITEWNIDVWGSIEGKKVGSNRDRGNQFFNSMYNAAFHGCVLTHLQDSLVLMAHHYRGDANGFGLLTESGELNRVGAFYQNLNKVMSCPQRLETISSPVQEAFTVLAGKSGDLNTIQILVSDARLGENTCTLELVNLPVGRDFTIRHYRLDENGKMKLIEDKVVKSKEKLILTLTLPAPTVDRIEILINPM